MQRPLISYDSNIMQRPLIIDDINVMQRQLKLLKFLFLFRTCVSATAHGMYLR
jgi:hypothetical protein